MLIVIMITAVITVLAVVGYLYSTGSTLNWKRPKK